MSSQRLLDRIERLDVFLSALPLGELSKEVAELNAKWQLPHLHVRAVL